MNTTTMATAAPVKGMKKFCRSLIFNLFKQVEYGTLSIIDSEGTHTFTGSLDPDAVHAELHIKDPGCYVDMLLGGSIGAGEAYMSGDWFSPDTT